MLEFSQLKIEELNKFKEANQLKYMDKVKEDRPKKIKDKEEVKYYSQNNNETVKILPNTEVKAIKNKNSNSKKSKKLNSNSKQLTIENTKKSNQFQKQFLFVVIKSYLNHTGWQYEQCVNQFYRINLLKVFQERRRDFE